MTNCDQFQMTYRLFTDDAVEFSGIHESFRLDRANIQMAIANVKSERHIYASQAAYDRHLAIYTGALLFLDSQKS